MLTAKVADSVRGVSVTHLATNPLDRFLRGQVVLKPLRSANFCPSAVSRKTFLQTPHRRPIFPPPLPLRLRGTQLQLGSRLVSTSICSRPTRHSHELAALDATDFAHKPAFADGVSKYTRNVGSPVPLHECTAAKHTTIFHASVFFQIVVFPAPIKPTNCGH